MLLLSFVFATNCLAAPIINGSFEDGLSGWTTNDPAKVQVVNSYIASDISTPVIMNPTDGDNFAVIKAGSPVTSLLSTSFFVIAGQDISFDWFFDGNDYKPFNDFGSYALQISVGGVPIVANILAQIATTGDFALTGWHNEVFSAPSSGEVQIAFYAVNAFDSLFSSVLGIDNIKAVGIPEPGTILLLALGLLGLTSFTRKNNIARVAVH